MGGLHESAASLGFFGDDLDPDELTRKLGATPTVGVRKGGIWHTPKGVGRVAARSSWRIKCERREPGDLDAQIVELLAPLSKDFTAWKDLSARYRGRIFCGLFLAEWNEGLSLEPATLLAMGERGLTLDLDIYSGSERDTE